MSLSDASLGIGGKVTGARRRRRIRPSAGRLTGANRRTAASKPDAVKSVRDIDLAGLVVALGPDLTGRIHAAYKRRTDRRWWRQHYPGWRVPKWDYVSICGRKGLIRCTPPQPIDCRACQRILVSRRWRLAQRTGTS
jgi:hypothetical protein